jgi:hypothetical protein
MSNRDDVKAVIDGILKATSLARSTASTRTASS